MYARNITELQSLVHGYYSALSTHHIIEDVPAMTQGHFGVWLRDTTGWSMSAGWGRAFDREADTDINIFAYFFSFVDEYRTLAPTITARVTLLPKHQPTGKRCKYGIDGLMERPDEILVVNYWPTSLNHLRHRYDNRYVDDWFLMLGDGSYHTTQSDLFDWVSDEFGIDRAEWEITARSTR